MAYTTDSAVRYYISAKGSATGGIGTNIVGTDQMVINIADSDSIIDMKLAKRYSVPFVTTPPAIATTSKVLTSWRTLRSVYSGEIPSSLAFVKEDYDLAMEWLNELKEGTVDLPSSTGTSSSGNVVDEKGGTLKYWSSRQSYTPVFDMDDDLNSRVDPDLIDDIATGRE